MTTTRQQRSRRTTARTEPSRCHPSLLIAMLRRMCYGRRCLLFPATKSRLSSKRRLSLESRSISSAARQRSAWSHNVTGDVLEAGTGHGGFRLSQNSGLKYGHISCIQVCYDWLRQTRLHSSVWCCLFYIGVCVCNNNNSNDICMAIHTYVRSGKQTSGC